MNGRREPQMHAGFQRCRINPGRMHEPCPDSPTPNAIGFLDISPEYVTISAAIGFAGESLGNQ